MAIDAIGLAGSSDAGVPANASVNQTDFLKILLTQLRFQDPLKPVDNQQFVAQLAQFSALEINRQQSEKIDTLLQISSSGQAIGLLGQRVEVSGASGGGVGEVFAVSFATGEPRLSVRTEGNPIVGARLVDIKLVQEGP
ncbi:MAG TPA: flagellar hook capping FlgD N-terminal domain-containing protein [Steroidobacteraceae bacterium]